MKNEPQRTPLAPRDIYNSNITSSSIEVCPFAKYHQQWASVELLYFPLCIYNGVKSFIAALNFYIPPRPNKNRGLCPTKSALLKQVKKFPGNDMYLNWSSEQIVLLVFTDYPYNRLSLWFKSLTYQLKLLLQNVRRVQSNAMFVEKY